MSYDSCTQVVSIDKYQSRIAVDNFQNNMGPVKILSKCSYFSMCETWEKNDGCCFC